MVDQRNANAAEVTWFADLFGQLVSNVDRYIRGKSEVVRTAAICIVANGHLLIEDPPGTGKTLLAKAFVASIDGKFQRVQCTPDLMPSDITGLSVYNPGTQLFVHMRGPVFTHLLLCDEMNRASPKTQSALLEVMEERRVSVNGTPIPVPEPFIVIATQNPIDGGTYRLPAAELDRFMMQLSVGHPAHAAAVEVLADRIQGKRLERLDPVMNTDDLIHMTAIANTVFLSDEIRSYIVTLQQNTQKLPGVSLGASIRGSIALQATAQARAASQGRTYVIAEDVKRLAVPVLAHRLILEPDAELRNMDATALVEGLLSDVPVPSHRVAV